MEEKKENVDPTSLQIPESLPILPLHGFVFFPGMGFPLQVASDSSKLLIDDALLGDRMIGLVPSRKEQTASDELVHGEDLYQVGVVGYIHKMTKAEEGYYQVLVSGTHKLSIVEYTSEQPYLQARVAKIPMEYVQEDKQLEAMLLGIRSQFKKFVELSELPQEMLATVNALTDPYHIGYLVTSQLNLKIVDEQEILEIVDVDVLLNRVALELGKRLETVEMSKKMQADIKKDIDGKQREFFLRQQLQAIRKELGEEDDEKVEIRELKERAEKKGLSKEAREAVDKELVRLERISPSSPEYSGSRNYIDWILDLPWTDSTTDTLDLDKAEKDLDVDHYGLDKIKKRILEFLAVRKLKPDIHGPILCFVGPPGVGKTSLGQSIAQTMERKFVRIALGGMRDEAEIRGHRRTYIGALPGRVIQSLKKAGANNPVFLLDEIDKLGNDFRGDPASALLEVLDPEQNATFTDHYLDIEFDLSKVMFIATANMLDTIPEPLRDRMEVLRISGYTLQEKVQIARRYLVPKALKEHGLKRGQVKFSIEALEALAEGYTAEAGVRNLERQIATLCRKVARKVAEGNKRPVEITPRNIKRFLGPKKVDRDVAERKPLAGVATGLAWTPYGGEILFIEATRMPGKGQLILTGSLGEVMKESARAALSYLRANASSLKLDDALFASSDIHIHVPAGATPKDGPSAGVAISMAILSMLENKPIRPDLAMTGEISLRGRVLPVGGIKEKVLAAARAGITNIVLPEKNRVDLAEIPEEIKKKLVFKTVRNLNQAIRYIQQL
jgi:ATP-dependent Lon protease